MNSGTIFKDLFGLNGEVPKYFSLLQQSIKQEEWAAAGDYLQKLKADWGKLLPRLQFSIERMEINHFQHSLARMKGFIEAQEKANSLAELRELEETWNDLGR